MTISPAYLEQQKQLHQNPNYGVASLQYAELVIAVADQVKAKSIADYGAGKCNLRKKMTELGRPEFDYFPYDPVFPDYGAPHPADLVACIDVLEHIEMEHLDAVLADLKGIMQRVGVFTIHTGPAIKHLPDGRNAHLIQQPPSWWLPRLCRFFEIVHLQRTPGGFWLLVEPLAGAASPENA